MVCTCNNELDKLETVLLRCWMSDYFNQTNGKFSFIRTVIRNINNSQFYTLILRQKKNIRSANGYNSKYFFQNLVIFIKSFRYFHLSVCNKSAASRKWESSQYVTEWQFATCKKLFTQKLQWHSFLTSIEGNLFPCLRDNLFRLTRTGCRLDFLFCALDCLGLSRTSDTGDTTVCVTLSLVSLWDSLVSMGTLGLSIWSGVFGETDFLVTVAGVRGVTGLCLGVLFCAELLFVFWDTWATFALDNGLISTISS